MSAMNPPSTARVVGKRSELVRIGALVLVVTVFVALALNVPGFVSPDNVVNLLRQTAILGIVALGQTVVMLVSGVDLSVSAIITVTVMIVAQVTGGDDALIPLTIAMIIVFAAIVGLANGLLITKRNVPPFMATLGMGVLVEGARLAYSHGYPSSTIPPGIRQLGVMNVGPAPLSFLIFLVMAGGLWFMLMKTTYGRRVYSTGLSPRVARLGGVNVDRVTISAYVLCSLLAALAGVILAGWVGYVDNSVGQNYAFDSITVVVIGGTSFVGGEGGVFGTLIAALVLQVILNLIVLLGIDPNVQLIAKACIVLAAVYLVERRRRAARGGE